MLREQEQVHRPLGRFSYPGALRLVAALLSLSISFLLSAMRVPRALLMYIISESRRCTAAISAGGEWIVALVASTDPVGDSISSSGAATNSTIDVALKIFRTRCTCVGRRANHLDLRTSSEALFPARERISRRSYPLVAIR